MKYWICGVLLVCSAQSQADSLGRLFFTPQQRARLESQRENHSGATGQAASVLMISGVVQKDQGMRTVWINGVAHSTGSSSGQDPEIVRVEVPGKAQSVPVRVGQKILLNVPQDAGQPSLR
jgi:hypothetical protein